MVAFWSSFAPAALITSIKNDLKLTKAQIADANVAAVCGGVVARLFIGKFMDSWGPRYAFMLCLWATAPAVFAMSKVTSFAGYVACRFCIAMSLAAVIPCIQWTTNMYNVGVVGTANAIVGGWGNLGEKEREERQQGAQRTRAAASPRPAAGRPPASRPLSRAPGSSPPAATAAEALRGGAAPVWPAAAARGASRPTPPTTAPLSPLLFLLGGGLTHIAMPLFFDALVKNYGHSPQQAWRLAFYLPGALHLFMGAAVMLLGQDMPDGRTEAVRVADGRSVKGDVGWPAWRAAVLNYRTWILTLVYAVTFGVEIAVDNVLSKYFQNHFSLTQTVGGGIAAVSGLLNIVSRPSGGVVSDLVSARHGHRARVTWLFVSAFLGGLFMLLFGALPVGLPAGIVLMVLYSFLYEQGEGWWRRDGGGGGGARRVARPRCVARALRGLRAPTPRRRGRGARFCRPSPGQSWGRPPLGPRRSRGARRPRARPPLSAHACRPTPAFGPPPILPHPPPLSSLRRHLRPRPLCLQPVPRPRLRLRLRRRHRGRRPVERVCLPVPGACGLPQHGHHHHGRLDALLPARVARVGRHGAGAAQERDRDGLLPVCAGGRGGEGGSAEARGRPASSFHTLLPPSSSATSTRPPNNCPACTHGRCVSRTRRRSTAGRSTGRRVSARATRPRPTWRP